jgi:hypothetical protein
MYLCPMQVSRQDSTMVWPCRHTVPCAISFNLQTRTCTSSYGIPIAGNEPTNTATYFFSFFFSFLAFSFFLSRFFNPCIPFLHTSAYFPKNSSMASSVTVVEIFNFPPSLARTRRGNVSDVLVSEKSSIRCFDSGCSGL